MIRAKRTGQLLMLLVVLSVLGSCCSGPNLVPTAQPRSAVDRATLGVEGDKSEDKRVPVPQHIQIKWQSLNGPPGGAIETDPQNHDILYASYSPKKFEDHASVWKYDRSQVEEGGGGVKCFV